MAGKPWDVLRKPLTESPMRPGVFEMCGYAWLANQLSGEWLDIQVDGKDLAFASKECREVAEFFTAVADQLEAKS
jgi:hypothetical protein